MSNIHTVPGYTGSEIERATLSSQSFPTESALERAIKAKLASYLTRLADTIAPKAVTALPKPLLEKQCC